MDTESLKIIGKRIQEARISCGMTQTDLAKTLGVKPQSVQHWERGASLPKSTRIHELAEALDVQPSWLLPNADEQVDHSDETLSFDETMMIRKYRKMDVVQRDILSEIANVLLSHPNNTQSQKNPSLKPK